MEQEPAATHPSRPPRPDPEERYWVRLGRKVRGPLAPGEISRLPETGLHTLLCPGRLNPAQRKNWKPARTFPLMRRLILNPEAPRVWSDDLEPAPTIRNGAVPMDIPPQSMDPLRTLGILGACCASLVLFWRPSPLPRPETESRVPTSRSSEPWEAALGLYLPACKATVGQKTGNAKPSFLQHDGDEYMMEWPATFGGHSLLLRCDPLKRLLFPMNAATRDALDPYKPCPS